MILVVFSYPLQAHPCRASLDKILAWTSPETRNRKVPPPPSAFKYFVVTTCILVASYLIAITVTELDVVSVHQEEKRKDGMLTACRFLHLLDRLDRPRFLLFYLVSFIINFIKRILGNETRLQQCVWPPMASWSCVSA